jgi:hypothetical protein
MCRDLDSIPSPERKQEKKDEVKDKGEVLSQKRTDLLFAVSFFFFFCHKKLPFCYFAIWAF